MTEMTKELVVARLANMRGEILSKIQPREQRDETETPPEQPYVFLRQRVEKPGEVILSVGEFIECLQDVADAVSL
ncbi:hypothetical protein HFO99_17745 [Rhizobium leguminosarum]|uniref:hypothetical protein n=1 Tax=Rhizobium leguminosarum TaxID=384 RepID=UPI001C94C440|nr:hypothetical protein [Rhizobium leguminosarum]MBY5335748.1 hypothetical protein [Rhizobium leguminosarum]